MAADDDSPIGFGPTVAAPGGGTLAGVPPPPRAVAHVEGPRPAGLAAGDRVGRYVIQRQVGAGGMGEVYAAHDPQLDRRVAIKVLRPVHRAASAAARLLREAQALARLDHPNVVAIHDVGEADGRIFLAMHYVEGLTLGEHVETHRPPWGQRVALYLAAGRGLAAAHAAGLIHRDFKPSNVLVDRAGVARVTDFGVARAAGDDATTSGPTPAGPREVDDSGHTPLTSDMTELGAVIGTPAFMAPEQHHGQRATARSDQFAFCASMWQSLFGRHPFVPADYGPVGSSAEYIAFITDGALVPPPAGHPVPRRIVAALTRGLSRRAEARWPTMTALLAELDEPPATTRTAVVVLSAVAALGTGAALWLGLAPGAGSGVGERCASAADGALAGAWGPVRAAAIDLRFGASGRPYAAATSLVARTALDQYAADWRAQSIAVCTSRSAPGAVDATLAPLVANREACLDHRLAGLAGTVDVLASAADAELVDGAAAVIAGLPPLATCADPARMVALTAPAIPVAVQIGPLEARLAALEARANAGLLHQVEAELPALRRDIDALGWTPLAVRALILDGNLRVALVRPDREPLLAAARLAMAHGLRDEAAAAWTSIVQIEGLTGSAAGVDAYHQVAAAAAAATGQAARALRERVQYGRALLRRGLGRRAEEVCSAVLADARAAADLPPRDLASARDCVLECAVRAGRYEEAAALAAEALADPRLALDGSHPAIADYLEVEAAAYERLGKLDLARAALLRGLEIRERAFGPRHVRVVESQVALADLEPDPRRRVELLEQALAVVDDPATAGPRTVTAAVKIHQQLADLAGRHGDPAAMQHHFGAALTLQTGATGPRSLEVAFLQLGFGQFLSEVDLDRSLAMLADAEGILVELRDPRLAIARGARANVLVRADRWAEALPVLEQIVPALPADSDPVNLGLSRFNLARALVGTGGDRERARALASEARADFARAGAPAADNVKQVDRWLRALAR